MKILVYHPTGNENVRALLRALKNNNMLHTFHTTIAVFESSWFYRFLRGKLSRFKRRTYDSNIKKQTKLYPFLELLLFAGKKKYKGEKLTGSFINKQLTKSVANYVKRNWKTIDGVYGYPFGSYEIFCEAKRHNVECIYELTTIYYKELKEITSIEKKINPQYSSTISIYEESDEVLKKIDMELNLADKIVVSSSYIKDSLLKYGFPEKKIKIIPYGFPHISLKNYTYDGQRKLKVLFAGGMSQIKGLSYMFKAIDFFQDKVILTLVGSITDRNNQELQTQINKYRYLGTLSHERLLYEMRENDVFLFPSLCDGFGLVITESMSQGTPVIASKNSAGRDLIKNNYNGWLIPGASSTSICEVLKQIIENPYLIELNGRNAMKMAENNQWLKYEKNIADFISEIK